MGNVQTDKHGLTLGDHTKLRIFKYVVVTPEFEVDLQRNISKVLIIPRLHELRRHGADIEEPFFDIAGVFDAVVESSVSRWEDYKQELRGGLFGLCMKR